MKRQCAVMRGGTAVELAARTARRRGRDAVVPREPRVAGAGPRRPSPPASAFRGSRDRFVQRIELPYSEVALTSQQRHAQRRYKDRIGVLCPTSTSRTAQSRSMATPRRSHAYAAAARTLLGPPPTSVCEPNGRRSLRRAVGSSGERRQATPRLYEPSHVPNRSTRVD